MLPPSPKLVIIDPNTDEGETQKHFHISRNLTVLRPCMPSIETDDPLFQYWDSSGHPVVTVEDGLLNHSALATSSRHSSNASNKATSDGTTAPASLASGSRESSRPEDEKDKVHADATPALKRGPGRPPLPDHVKAAREAKKKEDQKARAAAKRAKTAAAKSGRVAKRRKTSHTELSHLQRWRPNGEADTPSNEPRTTKTPSWKTNLIHPDEYTFRPRRPAPVGTFCVKRDEATHIQGESPTAVCEMPWGHPASVYFGHHPEFLNHGTWEYDNPSPFNVPRSPSVCTERTFAADWPRIDGNVDVEQHDDPAESNERDTRGLTMTTHHEEDDDILVTGNANASGAGDFDMHAHEATNPIQINAYGFETPSYLQAASQPPLDFHELMIRDSRGSGLIDDPDYDNIWSPESNHQ